MTAGRFDSHGKREDAAIRSEKISFENADGTALAGTIDLPPGAARAFALFAHCFSCSSQSHAAKRIAQALTLRGIATLRFDFTGLAASESEFADSHFAANVEDLGLATEYLSSRWRAPELLIGHSLGGAAVIAAAGDLASVMAVVTIGAPFDPAHALHHFGSCIDEIERVGEADVTIAGRTFSVRKNFLEAARGQDQGHRLAGLKRVLLERCGRQSGARCDRDGGAIHSGVRGRRGARDVDRYRDTRGSGRCASVPWVHRRRGLSRVAAPNSAMIG